MVHANNDPREPARGDTTPMIDCVFLLIIFFLCIDFRVLEAKLPAYLPRDSGSGPAHVDPEFTVDVRVLCREPGTREPRDRSQPDGPYRLLGHRVAWRVGALEAGDEAALAALLQAAALLGPGGELPPVVLRGGPGTTYGDMAGTLDALRRAGFEEIRFASAH